MKAISLFAGVGGFDLAFDRAGIETVAQVEIDSKCRAVLAEHFPKAVRFEDVKEFDASAYRGTVDVVCGGFPCQDLSVAGRRAGLAGARSGLFYEVVRVLEEARPEWVVLENVAGLLSSQRGWDMGAVLGELDDLGYVGAWRVLDSQYFGVAQRRRRVFLVGRLGAYGAERVLLEPEGVRRDSPPQREARPDVAGTLGGGPGTRGWSSDIERMTFLDVTQRAVGALTRNGVGTCGADDNQAQAGHFVPALARCDTAGEGNRLDGESCTFVTTAFHLTQDPISGAVSPALSRATAQGCPTVGVAYGLSENQRAEVRLTEYSRQITTGGGKPGQGYPAAFLPGELAVRRLTPRECERLQGFPDDWTASQTDSARYRMMGNAVTVNTVEWIATRLVKEHNASR